jgi:hypothetical protein
LVLVDVDALEMDERPAEAFSPDCTLIALMSALRISSVKAGLSFSLLYAWLMADLLLLRRIGHSCPRLRQPPRLAGLADHLTWTGWAGEASHMRQELDNGAEDPFPLSEARRTKPKVVCFMPGVELRTAASLSVVAADLIGGVIVVGLMEVAGWTVV